MLGLSSLLTKEAAGGRQLGRAATGGELCKRRGRGDGAEEAAEQQQVAIPCDRPNECKITAERPGGTATQPHTRGQEIPYRNGIKFRG